MHRVRMPTHLRKIGFNQQLVIKKMLPTRLLFTMLLVTAFNLPTVTLAAEHPLAGIPLRSIGPALTSGRVSDFAFHKGSPQSFYVAMASGNLWKTDNNGITWACLLYTSDAADELT